MTHPTRDELDAMTPTELAAWVASRAFGESNIAAFERAIAKAESHLARNTTHDEYGNAYTDLIAGYRASIANWASRLAATA